MHTDEGIQLLLGSSDTILTDYHVNWEEVVDLGRNAIDILTLFVEMDLLYFIFTLDLSYVNIWLEADPHILELGRKELFETMAQSFSDL